MRRGCEGALGNEQCAFHFRGGEKFRRTERRKEEEKEESSAIFLPGFFLSFRLVATTFQGAACHLYRIDNLIQGTRATDV